MHPENFLRVIAAADDDSIMISLCFLIAADGLFDFIVMGRKDGDGFRERPSQMTTFKSRRRAASLDFEFREKASVRDVSRDLGEIHVMPEICLEMESSQARIRAMAAVTEIIQDVLKLPRSERSFLAKKLLESLESDETFTAHEMALFQRRSSEIREGSVKPLCLEQLQQEVSSRMSSIEPSRMTPERS